MRSLLIGAVAAMALSGALAHAQAYDIYRGAGPAVVRLEMTAMRRAGAPGPPDIRERGTGFIVSENGYVLTAAHVVREAQAAAPGTLLIEATFPVLNDDVFVAQGAKVRLEIVRIAAGPVNDVALLRIVEPPPNLPFLSACDGVRASQTITMLGYAMGSDSVLSILETRVMTPSHQGSPMRFADHTSPGFSGGPVMEMRQSVVGVFLGQDMAPAQGGRAAYPIGGRALPSAQAVSALAPDSLAILQEVARCNQVDVVMYGEVFEDRRVTHFFANPIDFVTPAEPTTEVRVEFRAPRGTQFVVEDANWSINASAPGVEVTQRGYVWNNDRTRITILGDARSNRLLDWGSAIESRLEVPVVSQRPQVRTFWLSFEAASQGPLALAAPAGYAFTEVLGIETLTGAVSADAVAAEIAEDGRALNARLSANARTETLVVLHLKITPLRH